MSKNEYNQEIMISSILPTFSKEICWRKLIISLSLRRVRIQAYNSCLYATIHNKPSESIYNSVDTLHYQRIQTLCITTCKTIF